MRCAFIKSDSHWGGPWLSFKFHEVSIESIMKNSYGKAGHPIPMIIFFEMDVYCVSQKHLNNVDDINYNYNYNNTKSMDIYKEKLKKIQNIYSLDDINFNDYDVIYTEDQIIPKDIIDNHKNTLFVYNATEHEYKQYYYDLCIHHYKYIFPHPVVAFQCFITNHDRSNIYLEYRTAHSKECINTFEKNFPMKKIIYNHFMKDKIFPWLNLENDACDKYWYDLGKCKYYVQLGKYLQGVRVGQGFANATCLNLINIGFCSRETANFKLIHPRCICRDEVDAINIINVIEKDDQLYNDILKYQKDILQTANESYKNILYNGLYKKNITRNIDKKHISVTWPNELYKSAGDEDKFIIDYFKNKMNGFLLDIACACPVSGSLSFKLLNKFFWNGILIEPNPYYKQNIEACYSDFLGVKFYSGAIHNNAKKLYLYVPKDHKHVGLGSLIEENAQRYNNNIYKIKVNCASINDILDKYNAPREIDLIILDIEGSEGEVIYNIDYSKYNIKLFCIENGIIYEKFLKTKGYKICNTTGYDIKHGNTFFEKNI